MPEYHYLCRSGHRFTRHDTVSNHQSLRLCPKCFGASEQIITAPLLVKVAQDVCYDSPIDGKPITSQQARQEDMKRNNCTEYDPGQKQDYARRIQESEASLDQAVDVGVEEAIAKMPTAKRGKLYSELTEQGVQADVVRRTPDA